MQTCKVHAKLKSLPRSRQVQHLLLKHFLDRVKLLGKFLFSYNKSQKRKTIYQNNWKTAFGID